jgi:hypothetical protein
MSLHASRSLHIQDLGPRRWRVLPGTQTINFSPLIAALINKHSQFSSCIPLYLLWNPAIPSLFPLLFSPNF